MGHDDMVWRAEAVDAVLAERERALLDRPTERIPLAAIPGRVLAEDVTAPSDVPEHDKATMDGYAVDATEGYPLTVRKGEVFPEDDSEPLGEGEAVEIATGARLPAGANAVLKREDASVEGGQLTGKTISPGTYTYERGCNVEAGERLFEAGERLEAKDAILLGDVGVDAVPVIEQFSAGVLATGTEIHEGRQSDLDTDTLRGLVRAWGHESTPLGSVPDDYDRVIRAIAGAAAAHDVVITTGGTSVGHKDHVVRALRELGEVRFHRVRIRPGKPIAVAQLPDAVAFAIPGKPLGAYVVSALVMRPFFTGRTDVPTYPARLHTDLSLGPSGFEYVVPVTVDGDEATPLGHAGSPLHVYDEQFDPSVLSSSTRATRADGFVLTRTGLTAGEEVDVIPAAALE